MPLPRILVVGESLVDEVRRPGSDVAAHPGGSPANVAVGLARLGTPVTLLTRFGGDEYGDLLAAHLRGNSVQLAPDARHDGRTSVAVATLDGSGAATYGFRLRWSLDPVDPGILDGTSCLHTGSLATALEPGASVVRELMQEARGRVLVSYDPNVRPALLESPEAVRGDVEQIVGLADVVKASEEDLHWLYDREPVEAVARRWLALGPALVVVTRGGEGAYALTHDGEIRVPAPRVEVVDTVGAGDAFTAGLLDALAREGLLPVAGAGDADSMDSTDGSGGEDGSGPAHALSGLDHDVLRRVLDEAVQVAAVACTRPGADPPRRAQLPHLDTGGGRDSAPAPGLSASGGETAGSKR